MRQEGIVSGLLRAGILIVGVWVMISLVFGAYSGCKRETWDRLRIVEDHEAISLCVDDWRFDLVSLTETTGCLDDTHGILQLFPQIPDSRITRWRRQLFDLGARLTEGNQSRTSLQWLQHAVRLILEDCTFLRNDYDDDSWESIYEAKLRELDDCPGDDTSPPCRRNESSLEILRKIFRQTEVSKHDGMLLQRAIIRGIEIRNQMIRDDAEREGRARSLADIARHGPEFRGPHGEACRPIAIDSAP